MSDPIDKFRSALVDIVTDAVNEGIDREEILCEVIAGAAASVIALEVKWSLQRAVHEFELGLQDCTLQMKAIQMNPFRTLTEVPPEA